MEGSASFRFRWLTDTAETYRFLHFQCHCFERWVRTLEEVSLLDSHNYLLLLKLIDFLHFQSAFCGSWPWFACLPPEFPNFTSSSAPSPWTTSSSCEDRAGSSGRPTWRRRLVRLLVLWHYKESEESYYIKDCQSDVLGCCLSIYYFLETETLGLVTGHWATHSLTLIS